MIKRLLVTAIFLLFAVASCANCQVIAVVSGSVRLKEKEWERDYYSAGGGAAPARDAAHVKLVNALTAQTIADLAVGEAATPIFYENGTKLLIASQSTSIGDTSIQAYRTSDGVNISSFKINNCAKLATSSSTYDPRPYNDLVKLDDTGKFVLIGEAYNQNLPSIYPGGKDSSPLSFPSALVAYFSESKLIKVNVLADLSAVKAYFPYGSNRDPLYITSINTTSTLEVGRQLFLYSPTTNLLGSAVQENSLLTTVLCEANGVLIGVDSQLNLLDLTQGLNKSIGNISLFKLIPNGILSDRIVPTIVFPLDKDRIIVGYKFINRNYHPSGDYQLAIIDVTKRSIVGGPLFTNHVLTISIDHALDKIVVLSSLAPQLQILSAVDLKLISKIDKIAENPTTMAVY